MNPVWVYQYLGFIATVLARRDDYDRIGYFWHITDIHYDSHYSQGDLKKGCSRHEHNAGSNVNGASLGSLSNRNMKRRSFGRFGDYACDSTWALIESAAKHMMNCQVENVEFVLWTGDALSHGSTRHLNDIVQLEILQNLTELLQQTFPSQFVFPALGHDDPSARSHLGRMWSRWLPTDSLKTFESGGYYMIERKTLKLQLVVLNTNLMRRSETDEEAFRQWIWLDAVLNKFRYSRETVYLVGHTPPGWNEPHQRSTTNTNNVNSHHHQMAHTVYTDYHNKKFLQIIRHYADIVVGQFFGHLHMDTFRVIYDQKGFPVSWAMISPSLTPKRSHQAHNNPGLRLYKFDKDTGKVFDYTQYYFDLSAANSVDFGEWKVEYNFSSYYGMSSINATILDSLADKLFLSANDNRNSYFDRYYKATSVRSTKLNALSKDSCDQHCVLSQFCSITRVDREEYEICLRTLSKAVTSSSVLNVFILVSLISFFTNVF